MENTVKKDSREVFRKKLTNILLFLFGFLFLPLAILAYFGGIKKKPNGKVLLHGILTGAGFYLFHLIVYLIFLLGLLLVIVVTAIFSWVSTGIFVGEANYGVITLGSLIILYIAGIFTHSAVTAEVYSHKGYPPIKGALIGLLPGFGLYRALTLPNKKQVLAGAYRQVFSFKEITLKVLTFLFLTTAVFLVLFPIIYLFGASFTNVSELPTTLFPSAQLASFQNYIDLFEGDFLYWYKNTLIIAVLNMVLGVIFITGAGYVFARFKFKGKKAGLMAILVLQVFPSFMGLIAMFTLFQTFHLLGKPTWLTVLYVGGSIPGNIWLIKGYLSQIPKDLDESAMLDGANKWQIFFKIILPLAVPILSFVAVGQFMAPWMDYMLPRLLLDVQINPDIPVSQQWTLAVGLFSMISDPRSSSYTTFAAGALIVAVPITVLYMIFQRYLIEGITAGATKG